MKDEKLQRKKIKKKLDKDKLKDWRDKVLKRDKGICQICKNKPKKPHAHHIIPRQVKDLRYDVMNGIILCYNNHKVGVKSPHLNALWFYKWLKKNKPKQFKYLIKYLDEK